MTIDLNLIKIGFSSGDADAGLKTRHRRIHVKLRI